MSGGEVPKILHSGVLGLDDIVGGGFIEGESILVAGPPGSAKTLLAISILYAALIDNESAVGVFLTCDQRASRLRETLAGLFLGKMGELLESGRLKIVNFISYAPPGDEQQARESDLADFLVNKLKNRLEADLNPGFVVLDGLTALQALVPDARSARRLAHMVIAHFGSTHGDDKRFRLAVVTGEVDGGGADSFGSLQQTTSYLFDTVVSLELVRTGADRRLRTIEIEKSRGRHSRTGRHTFSIVSEQGLDSLIQSQMARDEVRLKDVPIVVYPREPRFERGLEHDTLEDEAGFDKTGIAGLDKMLDIDNSRGLRRGTTTLLVGGPGTASSIVSIRYLVGGIEQGQPVLLVSFGRDRKEFENLSANFPWLKCLVSGETVGQFRTLYYRPINLDQNRLFYEIRTEVRERKINRVVIDSVSSLPLVHKDDEVSHDFLVTLTGLLKELGCTAIITYVLDKNPEPMSVPNNIVSSLSDYVVILRNDLCDDGSVVKRLRLLKSRGANASTKEAVLQIGSEVEVVVQE